MVAIANTKPSMFGELYKFAIDHARGSAGQPFEADDLMQEMMIVCLEVADRYADLPKENLIKVVKTSMRNKVRDLIKARNVRHKYNVCLDDYRNSIMVNFDREFAIKNLVETLERNIDDKSRKVCNYIKEGYTITEIAEKEKSTKMSVYRALSNMKMLLQINFSDN